MQKLSDELWEVIRKHLATYYPTATTTKEQLEQFTEITNFDGGCFITVGNEFDLFVLPTRRGGRWQMRSVLKKFINELIVQHGSAIVRIHKNNKPSLRLAIGFGFKPLDHEGDIVRLEARNLWEK